MEAKYKSLTIFEFQEKFKDDEDCLKHLSNIKWAKGFKCKKCGHGKYCQGNGKYTRQCTSCNYNESPTCDTLFHKVKFSLLKAFYIVYYVSTNKKGIASGRLVVITTCALSCVFSISLTVVTVSTLFTLKPFCPFYV